MDPADALPELAATAVSRRGDLWLLGEHRILCGDARNRAAYVVVMRGEQVQMVFTGDCISRSSFHWLGSYAIHLVRAGMIATVAKLLAPLALRGRSGSR